MKNILFLLFSLWISTTQAKVFIDSTTFEEQRTKVNTLLDGRYKKFGEYDISLTQKTGIFGLFKTKNDMQKSIDILQEIVKNDYQIFIETRKLLAIKDGQAEKYQQLAIEYDNQVTAYMKTISKLQAENEKLRHKIDDHEDDDEDNNGIFFILGIIITALILVIFKQYKQIKTQKLT